MKNSGTHLTFNGYVINDSAIVQVSGDSPHNSTPERPIWIGSSVALSAIVIPSPSSELWWWRRFGWCHRFGVLAFWFSTVVFHSSSASFRGSCLLTGVLLLVGVSAVCGAAAACGGDLDLLVLRCGGCASPVVGAVAFWPAGPPVGELPVGGLLARGSASAAASSSSSSSSPSLISMVCSGSGGTSLCCGGCVVVGNGVVGALMLSSCWMAGVCGSVVLAVFVELLWLSLVFLILQGVLEVLKEPFCGSQLLLLKGLQLVVDLVQVRGPVALPSPHQWSQASQCWNASAPLLEAVPVGPWDHLQTLLLQIAHLEHLKLIASTVHHVLSPTPCLHVGVWRNMGQSWPDCHACPAANIDGLSFCEDAFFTCPSGHGSHGSVPPFFAVNFNTRTFRAAWRGSSARFQAASWLCENSYSPLSLSTSMLQVSNHFCW